MIDGIARTLVAIALASWTATAMPGVACANGSPAVPVDQISPDANVRPEQPGFAEHFSLEFGSGEKAQALLLRLSSPGYEPLFLAERRSWALSIELSDGQGWVIAYFYPDEARASDVWRYEPRERGVSRTQSFVFSEALREERVRAALRSAGLPAPFRFVSRTTGYVPGNGHIRRAIDPGRGTKCR